MKEFRRPGRPKGSRDKAPRKANAKANAKAIPSIMHIDSPVDEENALVRCGEDRIQIFEEIEAAEQTTHSSVSQENDKACSTSTVHFTTESVQHDDPFHADWEFW